MTRQVLPLLLLAACTSKPPPGPASDGPRGGDGGGRTAATSPAGTDPVEVIRQGAPVPVNAVTLAVVDSHDRVTLGFDAGLPGYRIEWVDAPIRCGSGDPAAIDGAAWLQVRMVPAVGHTEAGAPLVTPEFKVDAASVVTDIDLTYDFEAEVTWVIGTSRRVPFATRELLGPQRLEIDLDP